MIHRIVSTLTYNSSKEIVSDDTVFFIAGMGKEWCNSMDETNKKRIEVVEMRVGDIKFGFGNPRKSKKKKSFKKKEKNNDFRFDFGCSYKCSYIFLFR